MIFKLDFRDKTEYCTAKSVLHCLQSYEADYDGFQEIIDITEVTDEQAKEIRLRNSDFDEERPEDMDQYFPLFDSAVGDDFAIIGSSEW